MKITPKKVLGYARIYTSYEKPIHLEIVCRKIISNLYIRKQEDKELIKKILEGKYKEYEMRALIERKQFVTQANYPIKDFMTTGYTTDKCEIFISDDVINHYKTNKGEHECNN